MYFMGSSSTVRQDRFEAQELRLGKNEYYIYKNTTKHQLTFISNLGKKLLNFIFRRDLLFYWNVELISIFKENEILEQAISMYKEKKKKNYLQLSFQVQSLTTLRIPRGSTQVRPL